MNITTKLNKKYILWFMSIPILLMIVSIILLVATGSLFWMVLAFAVAVFLYALNPEELAKIMSGENISLKKLFYYLSKKMLVLLLSTLKYLMELASKLVHKVAIITTTISLLTVFTLYLFTLPHGLVGQMALFVHAHAQVNGMDFQSAYAVFSTAVTACILICIAIAIFTYDSMGLGLSDPEEEDSTEGK